MKTITQEEILNRFFVYESKGFHIDSRLVGEVNKGGSFYIIELNDEEAFLSLIWQEIDDSRLLTLKNKSRKLLDVANRFIEKKYSFDTLSRYIGLSANEHNPKWFEKCIPIDDEFNYENYGLISIVPATDGERKQSLNGSFYIYDGIHKSIVLATKLLKNEIAFQKIKA